MPSGAGPSLRIDDSRLSSFATRSFPKTDRSSEDQEPFVAVQDDTKYDKSCLYIILTCFMTPVSVQKTANIWTMLF